MARGRKFARGGAAKSQAAAAEAKPVEEAVKMQNGNVATEADASKEAEDVPSVEMSEPAEAADFSEQEDAPKLEAEKADDTQATPKKGNRKRMRVKKGRKPSDANASPKEKIIEDFAGLIFMCNTETKKDCFKYRVFGLPEAKKHIVDQVKKGTKLFLFDIDKKVLHGVYKASSEGGMNLIEEAYKDSKRKFPAQVRFRIHKDCMPLDMSAVKIAIKENYFRRNKFRCELSTEQVDRLMKLFRPLDSKGFPEPKTGRDARRDVAGKGKVARPPRFQQSRGPPRYSAPAPPRERAYKEYPPVYPRERHIPEMDLRMQPSYALTSEVTEAEILRQRHLRQVQEAQLEALDRRAYLPDPVVEASLARRRYLEDAYAAEQSLAVKRPLLHDSLYRDLEYQREAPYRSYGDGLHSLSGAVQYDPRGTLPAWP